MAVPLPLPSFDQFLNLDQFDQSNPSSASTSAPQVFIDQDNDSLGGINYADLFKQYLSTTDPKSPGFALPPLPSSPISHPFALTAPENDNPSSTTSFSPDVFSPSDFHVPGSPIGGFSPSSDNSGRSPISLGELDFDTSGCSDDLAMSTGPESASSWAIDPSFFSSTNSATGLEGLTTSEPPAIVKPIAKVIAEPDIVIKSEPVLATIPEARAGEDEEMNEDDEDEDEDGSDSDREINGGRTRRASSSLSAGSGSGSGKKSKRPTKIAKTSVAAFASSTLHPTSAKSTLPPVPEWNDKPDPETYKKLNSKEKRQLRNKISARNFRHRRKEYITTLEEEISTRDTIIAELRDEVGTMRVENKDLRSEVTLLKQKWDEMMEKMTSFSAPTPSSSALGLNVATGNKLFTSTASTSTPSNSASEEWALDSPKLAHATLPTTANVALPQSPVASGSGMGTRRKKASNDIVKPNLGKDVAPGLKRGTGSWATAGMGMGGMGGYMPVHTTMLPEFNFLNAKPTLPMFSTQSFNPAINNLTAAQRAELPSLTSHLRTPLSSTQEAQPASRGTFDNFFDTNPLWLRPENIEEYRGQLYGKVAHNMAGVAAAQKSGTSPNSNGNLPLPTGFKPAFFSTPRSSSSGPFLASSGKESRDTYPYTNDLLAFQSPSRAATTEEQQRLKTTAFVAGLATQTLFSRMTGAFVEAFAGNTAGGLMSREKVAAVLSGRASLKVVPNDDLVGMMGGLEISSTPVTRPTTPSHCAFDDVMQRWSSGKAGERPGTPTR